MHDREEEARSSIQSMALVNLVLGVWLAISPWILNYSTSVWNQVIFGIAVVVLSLVRLLAPARQWSSFFSGLCGVWLIIAPFIVGYHEAAAYWNGIVAGIIVAWLGFINNTMYVSQRHHHGTA
ncbi:MAG TPA: SPW repeat protein [Candidatus Saccharimonadales bacterium]|nr:SPW repeat protein [Candidatus Saccharimonadales bacterium]